MLNDMTVKFPSYSQIYMWPGCIVCYKERPKESETRIQLFESIMAQKYGVRVKYVKEILSHPYLDENNNPILDDRGRNDLLFAVHDDDITNLAFLIEKEKVEKFS